MPTAAVVLAVYTVMSTITFVAFALDKRAAARGNWRTPEATLHTLELLGGWPGALIAMLYIRHKNRKLPYIAIFILIILLHAAGWWVVLRHLA